MADMSSVMLKLGKIPNYGSARLKSGKIPNYGSARLSIQTV